MPANNNSTAHLGRAVRPQVFYGAAPDGDDQRDETTGAILTPAALHSELATTTGTLRKAAERIEARLTHATWADADRYAKTLADYATAHRALTELGRLLAGWTEARRGQ